MRSDLKYFKGAFVGDQHNSDTSPPSRTDNYTEAILKKIEFILDYCDQKDILFVVFLGDMFHRKNPNLTSHWLVQRLIKLFNQYRRLRKFSLVGNHDFTTNISGLYRQPIYTLFESGALEPLGLNPEPILLEFDGFCVELAGKPYDDSDSGTERAPEGYRIDWRREDSFKVAAFHSTLLPDGKSFFGSWVNFGQVAPIVGANLVGCGHYHPGYDPPVQQAHGITWCNPGAISRGTADDHNLTRQIKFCAYMYDGQKLATKMVDVPHRPGPEVFDVEALAQQKEEVSRHNEFIDSLQDPSAFDMDATTVDSLCRLVATVTDDAEVVAYTQAKLRDGAEESEEARP